MVYTLTIAPELTPNREVSMPIYEFVCNAYQKTLTKILTTAEHENEKIACPECGSENVEQRWAAFYAVTSKKSA